MEQTTKNLNIKSKTQKIASSGYTFNGIEIGIRHPIDTDILVKLPNGQHLILRYRIEGEEESGVASVDVCLSDTSTVYNWNRDMGVAPKTKGMLANVREVDQLLIHMPKV